MAIGRKEWIVAALAALGREGVHGIRVESLARKLKVTKGSFYWHFRDRPDLLESVLSEWEAETDWLIQESRAQRGARPRLERFVALVREVRGRIPESAIFMWAREDTKVARRVKRVERARIDFLASVLEAMDIPTEEAELRAELAYLAFVGMADRLSRDPGWEERRDYLLDHLVAVFLVAPENVRFSAEIPDGS
jgi:AcrR family transcriptional regulator